MNVLLGTFVTFLLVAHDIPCKKNNNSRRLWSRYGMNSVSGMEYEYSRFVGCNICI